MPRKHSSGCSRMSKINWSHLIRNKMSMSFSLNDFNENVDWMEVKLQLLNLVSKLQDSKVIVSFESQKM